MRNARVLAVALGVLVATLGFGRSAQALGDPADDDICAFLNANGETILEDALILKFLTDSSVFGAGPGADGLIEGSNDFGLVGDSGSFGNPDSDDDADPRNDLFSGMPGNGVFPPMDYDETGPDADDTDAGIGTVNPIFPPGAQKPGESGETALVACDDFPACTSPHGSFSYSDLFILRCDDGTTVCNGTPGRVSPDCVGIGTETCNKILVDPDGAGTDFGRGYLNGSLSSIQETVTSNELVGEGVDSTNAITPGNLSFVPGAGPHRIDLWVEGPGPDGFVRTDNDNTAECINAGFPFGAANGVAAGEDGMSSWISTVSTDLPLLASENKAFFSLGNVRPSTPNQRILRATGDLMLKTSDGAGAGVGTFTGSDVWLYGWLMPTTEALALTRSNRFANGNLPDLVVDQLGHDGAQFTGDEIIVPGTGLAQYLSEIVRQNVGGVDKSTALLMSYFTVYAEISGDTMAALTGGAITSVGHFQQFIVATGNHVTVDACAIDVNDNTTCPVGTPVMAGGRCEIVGSPADGEFCFSDGFCETLGAPAGTRCIPNVNVSKAGLKSGTVIPGSDGN